MEPLRLAVLVSGRGSNLQAILDAVARGALDVSVAGVFSDRPEPPAFQWARQHGVPVFPVVPGEAESRADYDARLAGEVQGVRPQAVALAGFMRVLSSAFLDVFPDRVINIHPALLPAFRGLDAQAQAVAAGVRFSGCTVHFVDSGMDTGPIICSRWCRFTRRIRRTPWLPASWPRSTRPTRLPSSFWRRGGCGSGTGGS